MWPPKLEHPCQFTLNLLWIVLEKTPVTFPEERKREMKKKYDEFLKNKKVDCLKVEEAVVFFGKEIWPYRKAWQEMYEKYGRPKEAKYFEKSLPKELHEKYFSCKVKGGGHCLREYRMCGLMEKCFTPDEKFLLDQTVISTLNKTKEEVDKLVLSEKKDEYQNLFEKWKSLQKVMIEKIEELRKMANLHPKWRAEILDKIKTIERGWSLIEQDINLSDIEKVIDFYKGAIESPEAY
jgi:hypothetical protein